MTNARDPRRRLAPASTLWAQAVVVAWATAHVCLNALDLNLTSLIPAVFRQSKFLGPWAESIAGPLFSVALIADLCGSCWPLCGSRSPLLRTTIRFKLFASNVFDFHQVVPPLRVLLEPMFSLLDLRFRLFHEEKARSRRVGFQDVSVDAFKHLSYTMNLSQLDGITPNNSRTCTTARPSGLSSFCHQGNVGQIRYAPRQATYALDRSRP